MDKKTLLDKLTKRYPALQSCITEVEAAADSIIECYRNGGKLLICGNGGSAADADHIVGELLKSFSKKRPVQAEFTDDLKGISEERGALLSEKLERGLPAISLNAHAALISAISNDIGGEFIYAQQVLGYGNKNDILIGITTSGNSQNIIDAAITAKAKGMKVIGLTGETGGNLKEYCDVSIRVPSGITPVVQEYHLPVYHILCQIVEHHFY